LPTECACLTRRWVAVSSRTPVQQSPGDE
jgi:hypothetical protein